MIYHFKRDVWGAIDTIYYVGGRTKIDGMRQRDLQESWRLGLTFSIPVNMRNSVKLYGSSGIAARRGLDFDAVGIAWQYRWGGGV